jgi:hypothetical protein
MARWKNRRAAWPHAVGRPTRQQPGRTGQHHGRRSTIGQRLSRRSRRHAIDSRRRGGRAERPRPAVPRRRGRTARSAGTSAPPARLCRAGSESRRRPSGLWERGEVTSSHAYSLAARTRSPRTQQRPDAYPRSAMSNPASVHTPTGSAAMLTVRARQARIRGATRTASACASPPADPVCRAGQRGRGARRSRRLSSSSASTTVSIGWPGTHSITTTNRLQASARLLPS